MTNLFKTFLKPSESVMAAMATAAIVYAVYQSHLPTVAEVHATDPHNTALESGRKKALYTSGAVVGAMFLLTHDANVFMAGAGATVVLDWMHRHANAVNPNTGKMVPRTQRDALNSVDYATVDQSMPDYVPEYFQ